jgi:hypothetical protein
MRWKNVILCALVASSGYHVTAQHVDHTSSGSQGSQGAPAAASAAAQRKMQQAMRAAPPEISAKATIMDWPEKDGMPMKQLRAGTNGWMCMPPAPSPASRPAPADPMCADKTFAVLLDSLLEKTDPNVKAVGVSYMLLGDAGTSNTDPFATAPTATNQWIVSPPHLMLVVPDAKQLDAFPSDPHAGGPWVMWKGTKYAHLMIPTAAMPKPPAHR